MNHQAFKDVKNDIHHILEDTKRLTEDSLSLVADVERLEKNCKEHWKELLLDFLCSLFLQNKKQSRRRRRSHFRSLRTHGSCQNCRYSGMVLQEMAQVLQRGMLPDLGRFHGSSREIFEGTGWCGREERF